MYIENALIIQQLLDFLELCLKEMFIKNGLVESIIATSSKEPATAEMLELNKGSGWTPTDTQTPQKLTIIFNEPLEIGGLEMDAINLKGVTLMYKEEEEATFTPYQENGETKVRLNNCGG